jgi:hypothetical protein
MKTRYVIAALTVAFVGVASLAHAQAPEQSAAAKAAFQPPSDAAGPAPSGAIPAPTMKSGKSSVERTEDPSAGKGSVAKPSAAFTAK